MSRGFRSGECSGEERLLTMGGRDEDDRAVPEVAVAVAVASLAGLALPLLSVHLLILACLAAF